MLLWLWCRLTAGVWIRPLAWELSYVAGAALKSKKKKKNLASIQEDSGSTPGLTQWVKDLVLPQAAV